MLRTKHLCGAGSWIACSNSQCTLLAGGDVSEGNSCRLLTERRHSPPQLVLCIGRIVQPFRRCGDPLSFLRGGNSRSGPKWVEVRKTRPASASILRAMRSEEHRVGEEGVSTCRSRWSPDH